MPGISTSSSTPGPFKIVHMLFDTLVAPWLNAAAKLVELRPLSWTWRTAWLFGVAAACVVLAYNLYRERLESQKPQAALDSNHARSWFCVFILSITAMGATLVPVWVHPSQPFTTTISIAETATWRPQLRAWYFSHSLAG